MSNQQKQRDAFSLTSIYQALQNPKSTIATRSMTNLQNASIKEIDYTLRKIHSYVKHKKEQWPERRLVRCLDYIFIYSVKPQLEERMQLPSFKANVRWILDMLQNTTSDQQQDVETVMTLQLQSAIKFFCGLSESVSSQLSPDSSALISFKADIKHREGIQSLLILSQSSIQSIRIYCIRALMAQLKYFTKEMTNLNTFEILSRLLLEIPSLLNTISIRPPVTDIAQRRVELDHSIMACRLLESIFKYEPLSQPSESRLAFAESDMFQQLVNVWQAACHYDYQSGLVIALDDEGLKQTNKTSIKNLSALVYSLTIIIQRCTHVSKKAASCVAEAQIRAKWQPLLALCMQTWICGTCCITTTTTTRNSFTPAMLDKEKSIMKKLIQISLDIVSVLQCHMHWLAYVDQMILDLTNFVMSYVSQPILPEQASMVGTTSTLIHTDLCIDVEERGYQLDGTHLEMHQDLFVLILESFIQHVQIASSDVIKRVSSRVAWCLKSILTILLNVNQLEMSVLRSRVLRLIVFFLHYDEAISVLATSTTNITHLVWGPTIDMAKQGLMTISSCLSPAAELTAAQSVTVYKAKRAFIALEMILRHPRACERLVDCDVLQLVNISFIPQGQLLEKSRSLLVVYALFGKFIAALSRRTAFVRNKLRDECSLFPVVMKLLHEAIECKENRRRASLHSEKENDRIMMGWNHIISSCLMVVSSFQYDEASMRLWLSWGNNDDTPPSQKKLSILPYVLAVLFPWRYKAPEKIASELETHTYLKSDYQVMLLAAQVLDQLSSIPLCGRQMIMDKSSLPNLSKIMVALNPVHFHHPPSTTTPLLSSNNEMMDESIQQVLSAILSIEDDANKPPQLLSSTTNEPFLLKRTNREELQFQFTDCLRRSAIRLLSSNDNTQFIILSDAFTSFFEPMLKHPSRGTSHEYWRHILCTELHDKRMQDFKKLYKFTAAEEENTIKLHEFSAVAVGYATVGVLSDEEWNQTLGLTVLENSIVSTNHVFAIFCQMLLYELEYKEDSTMMSDDNSLLTLVTPFRRHAAAQMIETLAFEFEDIWRIETETIQKNAQIQPDILGLAEPKEIVSFITDDAPPNTYISGNRQLLRARSVIFEALLSTDYAESTMAAIPLHDVTFCGLKHFIRIIHQLNEVNMKDEIVQVLDPSMTWKDIIDLLHISDQFGAADVKQLCEYWILEKVKHLNDNKQEERVVCLEGMIDLYRLCRDPIEKDGGITSDTWPFATVLRESLKAIIQYMTESSQISNFLQMIQDKNIEELDAFCNGLASLLKK